jgi:Cytochrome c554 and c-prime
MSDERSAHGSLRPDVVAKDDWVFKACSQFQVDVLNISSHDLRYFSSLLAKPEVSRRLDSELLLGRLVSANTLSESAGFIAPHPFIVREVPSRRPGAKPIRVAFIGLTETTPAPPPGFRFIDPVEAVRRTLPEARKQANLVIVLAKIGTQEAARIAREAPGIDVIIAGNAVTLEGSFTPPLLVGQTMIAFTPFETRMLGELRFYPIAQGKFSTRQRFIALDETAIAEDPAAKQLVDAATRAETEARSNSKNLLENWLTGSRAPLRAKSPDRDLSGGESPSYVTSAACSQCHLSQYMKWANSVHAHATDPLLSSEFETSCLNCHATGSKLASATNRFAFARLQNVQCEQCHGPGSDHVAKPAKGYGRIPNMQGACASCHSSETSPGFDFQVAWAKIKH